MVSRLKKKTGFFLRISFFEVQFATKIQKSQFFLIYVYLTISMSSSSAGPEMARNL